MSVRVICADYPTWHDSNLLPKHHQKATDIFIQYWPERHETDHMFRANYEILNNSLVKWHLSDWAEIWEQKIACLFLFFTSLCGLHCDTAKLLWVLLLFMLQSSSANVIPNSSSTFVVDTFKFLKPAEFDVLLDDIKETHLTMSESLHIAAFFFNGRNCGKDQTFKTSIQRIYGQSLL